MYGILGVNLYAGKM